MVRTLNPARDRSVDSMESPESAASAVERSAFAMDTKSSAGAPCGSSKEFVDFNDASSASECKAHVILDCDVRVLVTTRELALVHVQAAREVLLAKVRSIGEGAARANGEDGRDRAIHDGRGKQRNGRMEKG